MSNSSAYFVPLVMLPTIITGPGRYLSRCGQVIEIDVAPTKIRAHGFDCLGSYPHIVRDRWHRSGRLYATSECSNDIIGKALALPFQATPLSGDRETPYPRRGNGPRCSLARD